MSERTEKEILKELRKQNKLKEEESKDKRRNDPDWYGGIPPGKHITWGWNL